MFKSTQKIGYKQSCVFNILHALTHTLVLQVLIKVLSDAFSVLEQTNKSSLCQPVS